MLVLWLPELIRQLCNDRNLFAKLTKPTTLFFLDSPRTHVFAPAPDFFSPFKDASKACRDFQEIIEQAELANRVSWHKGSSYRRHEDFLKFALSHHAPFDKRAYCAAMRKRYGTHSDPRLLVEAFFLNGYEGTVSMIFKLWPGIEIVF